MGNCIWHVDTLAQQILFVNYMIIHAILLSFGTMLNSARMSSEQCYFTFLMHKVINYPDINELELNVFQ